MSSIPARPRSCVTAVRCRPVPLRVDAGRDQAVHVHGAGATLADLLVSASIPAERVRPGIAQRPVPEGLHQLVQLTSHRGHLRLGQAHDTRGKRPASPPAGRDAQPVAGRPRGAASARWRGGDAPGTPGSAAQARSFGIASSIVPAPGCPTPSAGTPLREFTRSGVTSPYPALHATSTSASIIRCANSRIISRSMSGLADARVCSNWRAGNRHNVTCGHFALLRLD